MQEKVSIPHRYYKSWSICLYHISHLLVSIPHRYYKSDNQVSFHYAIDEFQFLIGIINPPTKSPPYYCLLLVSIPHRYYKSACHGNYRRGACGVSIPHRYYKS